MNRHTNAANRRSRGVCSVDMPVPIPGGDDNFRRRNVCQDVVRQLNRKDKFLSAVVEKSTNRMTCETTMLSSANHVVWNELSGMACQWSFLNIGRPNNFEGRFAFGQRIDVDATTVISDDTPAFWKPESEPTSSLTAGIEWIE